jgi:hypothetical protein
MLRAVLDFEIIPDEPDPTTTPRKLTPRESLAKARAVRREKLKAAKASAPPKPAKRASRASLKPADSEDQARLRTRQRVASAHQRGTEPDPEDLAYLAETDLANLVTKRTMQRIKDGSIEPTVRDGIAAQQIIDRRAERAEDRAFMLNLARALAGGGNAVPTALLPDGNTVEGEFTEMDPAMLAPAHLRGEA